MMNNYSSRFAANLQGYCSKCSALELDLEPAHYRGDLVRQISSAIVRLNQKEAASHPDL